MHFQKLTPKNQTSLKIVLPPPWDVINNRSLNLHKTFSTFKCHSDTICYPKHQELLRSGDVLDVSCNMRIEIAGVTFFPKNKAANFAINRNTLPLPPKKIPNPPSPIPHPNFPVHVTPMTYAYKQTTTTIGKENMEFKPGNVCITL